jgi:hypothetical protein
VSRLVPLWRVAATTPCRCFRELDRLAPKRGIDEHGPQTQSCPRDPFLDDLARRIIDATTQRYGTSDLPGQATGSGPGLNATDGWIDGLSIIEYSLPQSDLRTWILGTRKD